MDEEYDVIVLGTGLKVGWALEGAAAERLCLWWLGEYKWLVAIFTSWVGVVCASMAGAFMQCSYENINSLLERPSRVHFQQ